VRSISNKEKGALTEEYFNLSNRLYMKRREKVSITFPKKTSACAFLQQKKAATTKFHLMPTTLALSSSDMNDTRHKEHLIFSFHHTQLSSLPKWYNA
jgi:hypothetical protein